jgi:glyoxylase-like metal-dependent hydrolase (beta-lactamase superfamily II)
MLRIMSVLLAFAACVAAAGENQAETFVIHAGQDGREATVKIPVGAVSAFSANNAVALTDYMDPRVEAMRLSGNVRIQVIGTPTPIQIRADHVVLELTADEKPARADGAAARLHPPGHVQSAHVIVDDDQTQTFVGDVVFTEETSSGALEIKAERLERLTRPFAGL